MLHEHVKPPEEEILLLVTEVHLRSLERVLIVENFPNLKLGVENISKIIILTLSWVDSFAKSSLRNGSLERRDSLSKT